MEHEKFNSSHENETAQLNEYDDLLLSQIIKMVKEEMVTFHRKASLEIERRVVLRTAGSIEFVSLKDILRCEAQGRYTKVIFTDGTYLLVSMHLKEVEAALMSVHFIRSHNSHLINRNKIKRYNKADGGFFEMTNGDQIPVARARKEHIMRQLDNRPD
jgi:two-component system LytT family response regulator